MIIHHKEDFSQYSLNIHKELKYSESFIFVPLSIVNLQSNQTRKCIFQTPLLFSPYGIQETQNNKKIIDLSFQNKDNDNDIYDFLKKLKKIYKTVQKKYTQYDVNSFLKETQFNECMRLKIDPDMLIYDNHKNRLAAIDSFSYGYYIIHLHGLWINEQSIWFQWYLLQSKIFRPVHLAEYSFLDEIAEIDEIAHIPEKSDDKYAKMLKMGVPKEAIERQKLLDQGLKRTSDKGPQAPPPPPPLPNRPIPMNRDIPRVTAADLQSVQLKKNTIKVSSKVSSKKLDNDFFEPPSVEELQTTLSRLKKVGS